MAEDQNNTQPNTDVNQPDPQDTNDTNIDVSDTGADTTTKTDDQVDTGSKDVDIDDKEVTDEFDKYLANLKPEVRDLGGSKDDDLDLDEIDPEDAKVISKIIEKKLTPLQQKIQRQNDELEVNQFIAQNPEMAKYKPAILKYMEHPVYRQIPVENIAAIVASKDLMRLGAQKEREAQRKAKESQDKSQPATKTTNSVDWSKVPLDQMEEAIARAKGMQI